MTEIFFKFVSITGIIRPGPSERSVALQDFFISSVSFRLFFVLFCFVVSITPEETVHHWVRFSTSGTFIVEPGRDSCLRGGDTQDVRVRAL